MNREVVINCDWGGFCLSLEALVLYHKYSTGEDLYVYVPTNKNFQPNSPLDFKPRNFKKVTNYKTAEYSEHVLLVKDLGPTIKFCPYLINEGFKCRNEKEQKLVEKNKKDYEQYQKDIAPWVKTIYDFNIPRHDPNLVRVVKELGSRAAGRWSKLSIVDIGSSPYRIEEYDGMETVILPEDEEWL